MSVPTEAEDFMEDAMKNIEQAIKAIGKVLTTEVWGYEDYSDSYKIKIRDSFINLVDMRDRLK